MKYPCLRIGRVVGDNLMHFFTIHIGHPYKITFSHFDLWQSYIVVIFKDQFEF